MDELNARIAALEPPIDPAATARALRRIDQLQRAEPARKPSRLSIAAAATSAALVGAFVAGGTVAAAANGVAPAPVTQVLTESGVLQETVSDSVVERVEEQSGLVARTSPEDADGSIQVAILHARDEITDIEILLADGTVIPLTASTTVQPRVFLGRLPADLAGDAVLIARAPDESEVYRGLLNDADRAVRDLEAVLDGEDSP